MGAAAIHIYIYVIMHCLFLCQLSWKQSLRVYIIFTLFFHTTYQKIHKTLLAFWISISQFPHLIKTIIIINGHFLKFTSSVDSLFQFQTCFPTIHHRLLIVNSLNFIRTTQQNTNTTRHLFARMKPNTILQFSYKSPSYSNFLHLPNFYNKLRFKQSFSSTLHTRSFPVPTINILTTTINYFQLHSYSTLMITLLLSH